MEPIKHAALYQTQNELITICCVREMTLSLREHRASEVLEKQKQSLVWKQVDRATSLELTFPVGLPQL